MSKSNELIQEVNTLKKTIQAKENEAVRQLFKDIPNLKNITLKTTNEYNDENSYDYIIITKINGVDLDTEEDLNNYFFEHKDPLAEILKSQLFEMDLKEADFYLIGTVLFGVSEEIITYKNNIDENFGL